MNRQSGFKFYEAGMDLGMSGNPEESFRLFQGRILQEYERMIPEFSLHVIDATLPIEAQQQEIRRVVKSKLGQAKRLMAAP
jgi:dTMP kinase